MHTGGDSAGKLVEHCGAIGLEAVKAWRDLQAFGLPVAGGLEDQPAKWYQIVTIYDGEKGRLEKKDRDDEAAKNKRNARG